MVEEKESRERMEQSGLLTIFIGFLAPFWVFCTINVLLKINIITQWDGGAKTFQQQMIGLVLKNESKLT